MVGGEDEKDADDEDVEHGPFAEGFENGDGFLSFVGRGDVKPGDGDECEFDEGEDDGETDDECSDEIEFGFPHELDGVREGVDSSGGEREVNT
ncbi:hypothetical protein KS4_36190 [Poriferisphaera corsica]|uniref:Uncharacterized protein n=1 Tax=Poriferisphaera corsica TaxID=2528020 RepID=A0A517YZ87_9BACT|nr:hypothetical protein KS4_36190 [Poriferisphaera corsica]